MKTFLKWFGIGVVILVITVMVLLAINLILPPEWKMGSEVLIFLSAAILSGLFTYFPELRVVFAGLESKYKSYVNLALIVLLSVVMYLGTCTGLLPIAGIECSQAGIKTLALYIFLAAGGNQLTYNYSPQPVDVREAKAARSSG